MKIKRRLNEIYVKHTGRDYDKIERTLDRDHFMSAEEAKAFGIVDNVYDKRPEDQSRKGGLGDRSATRVADVASLKSSLRVAYRCSPSQSSGAVRDMSQRLRCARKMP